MAGKQQAASFRSLHTFAERQAEAQRIVRKYDDRVPVITERARRSTLPEIDQRKYLVPADLTMAQLQHLLRKRLKMLPQEGIYTFVETKVKGKTAHILPPTSDTLGSVYAKYMDEDGFLYLLYSHESIYGGV